MSRNLRFFGAISLLCAVILSLLVSTQIPAMNLVRTYFDTTTSQSGNVSITFATGRSRGISEIGYGVWSACIQGKNIDSTCFPGALRVGYGFTIQVDNGNQTSAAVTVTKAWTRGLVIHTIGTAVTFVAIPFSMAKCTIRVGLIFSVLSFLFGLAGLIIDALLIAYLKNTMATLKVAHTEIKMGFWMWLLAMAFVLFANLCLWGSLRVEGDRQLKHERRQTLLESKR